MRISLLTATGQGNLGDELILSQEVKMLGEVLPQSQITIFSHDIQSTQEFLSSQKIEPQKYEFQEYFPNNLRKQFFKNAVLKWQNFWRFAKSDLIIIGGGGLLYEQKSEGGTGLSPLFLWGFRSLWAKILGKRVLYWSIGISVPAKKLKRYKWMLFGKKTQVTVRDKKSREILQEISVQATHIPDPVFTFEARETEESQENKIVGLALRADTVFANEEGSKQLSEIIQYLQAQNYTIIALPHSFHHQDVRSNDWEYLLDFVDTYGLEIAQSPTETLEAYEKIDLLIGMRLHSCILGALHKIPTVCLPINQKIQELTRDLELTTIEPQKLSQQSLQNAISEIQLNDEARDLSSKAWDIQIFIRSL